MEQSKQEFWIHFDKDRKIMVACNAQAFLYNSRTSWLEQARDYEN